MKISKSSLEEKGVASTKDFRAKRFAFLFCVVMKAICIHNDIFSHQEKVSEPRSESFSQFPDWNFGVSTSVKTHRNQLNNSLY